MGAVLLLGLGFASWNAGQRVTIDLGLFTLYRVPVTFVAFGGMVVGMGVVLVAGINADLKVRALLQKASLAASASKRNPLKPVDEAAEARSIADPPASALGPMGSRPFEASQDPDGGPPPVAPGELPLE